MCPEKIPLPLDSSVVQGINILHGLVYYCEYLCEPDYLPLQYYINIIVDPFSLWYTKNGLCATKLLNPYYNTIMGQLIKLNILWEITSRVHHSKVDWAVAGLVQLQETLYSWQPPCT